VRDASLYLGRADYGTFLNSPFCACPNLIFDYYYFITFSFGGYMQAIPLDLYEELEALDPRIKSVFLKLFDYLMKERVTKDDFQRLTEKVEKLADIVAELAEAQKSTKEELKALSKTVSELAEAQKRTDQRLAELAEAQKRTEEELKALSKTVSELAEAQKRTDQKLAELAETQKRTEQRLAELAEAQKRTDQKLAELAEAQKRTDQRVAELAEAQKKTEEELKALSKTVAELAEAQKRTEEEVRTLAQELKRTRQDLGGLSLSFSYAFENEAYRMLPQVLKKYGLELEDKLIRKEVAGEEINFFATARKNGKTVYIVGETKLRLDDTKKRDDVFKQLEKKISAVKKVYGDVQIVPLIVTHFAKESMLKKAKEKGIIVVQSFEW
jgi:chromosome segregation ATPase